ncbi:MAG: 5'-methylthioadenosine/adenosylhomocysteine nucleosidase [Spirochaetaceae bacterium]|jgi:adenosylhomocysteine nucleosidase|nr:5'-methylthioadenosine/adenosylhomocysteine nucleosidase [Spirochaetaceae bacterium]
MIGIIGAMEEEITILQNLIQNRVAEKTGPFEYFTGSLEDKQVVLLRCGIGKVNAAIGTTLLINRFKPELVINTGCAGGVNPAGLTPVLNFGDVVVSSALVYHDVDISPFGYAAGQVPGMKDAFFHVDESVIRIGLRAINELKDEGILPASLNHVEGLVGSGDVFVCDAARVGEIVKLFPAVRAVEMEGAAIAHACSLFAVPCLVIRAMSDIAGEESPMKFDEYLPVAAKHSSGIVRRIVKLYQRGNSHNLWT